MLQYFLILFSIILLVKVIINAYRLNRTCSLRKLYVKWVSGTEETSKILQRKQQVIGLWEDAGLESASIPILEPVGYGKLRAVQADVFLQFPHRGQNDITNTTFAYFDEAIGVYKKRIIDAINPFEWLIFLVKMPEVTLKSAGLEPKKWLSVILNSIWQIFIIVVTIILNVYSKHIEFLFSQIINTS